MSEKSLVMLLEEQRLDLNEALGLPRQSTNRQAVERARTLLEVLRGLMRKQLDDSMFRLPANCPEVLAARRVLEDR